MKVALCSALMSALGSGVPVEWGSLPSPVFPAVVLNVISESARYTHSGESGLHDFLVQVDCYAATYGGADALFRQVHAVLSDTWGDLIGAQDGRESGTNEAVRPYRVSADYRIHHAIS